MKLEPDPNYTRILVPLCWTLWGILAAGLLYWFVRIATEKTSSPEAGPGLGLFMVLVLAALLAGAGFAVAWAARKQSTGWLITMAIVLAYPLVPAIARPIILARKERRWADEAARVGDFRDVALAPMAEAIRNEDAATLARLLGGNAPPAGKDRAGNDLFAYAADLVRSTGRGVASVRTLLDAGADPRTSRTGDGIDPLNHVMDVGTPAAREVARLLLEHGADPNAVDPVTGNTPLAKIQHDDVELLRLFVDRGANIDHPQSLGVPAIVHFMGSRQLGLVLYLVDKGARLDISNADGLSVDYYLKSWKESYYNDHPEGWERVAEAIEKRRAAR